MTTIDNGYGARLNWSPNDWAIFDADGDRLVSGEPSARLVEESLAVVGGKVPAEIRTICGRTTIAYAGNGSALFVYAVCRRPVKVPR